jgi:hypothetical protein
MTKIPYFDYNIKKYKHKNKKLAVAARMAGDRNQ